MSVLWRDAQSDSLSVCPFSATERPANLTKNTMGQIDGCYLATGSKKTLSQFEEEQRLFQRHNHSSSSWIMWKNTELRTHMNTNWYLRLVHGNLMTSLVKPDNREWLWTWHDIKRCLENGQSFWRNPMENCRSGHISNATQLWIIVILWK